METNQRAVVIEQQPQQLSPRSSLAQTLRSGLQRNEEWQDSNSFIYTDPRFDSNKLKWLIQV